MELKKLKPLDDLDALFLPKEEYKAKILAIPKKFDKYKNDVFYSHMFYDSPDEIMKLSGNDLFEFLDLK